MEGRETDEYSIRNAGISVLDTEQTKNMILAVCDAVIENKPYLTEVDSRIGDGDHGIGMALGMEKVKARLAGSGAGSLDSVGSLNGTGSLNGAGGLDGAGSLNGAGFYLHTVNDVFRETGMAMLESMGGASGVIFSAMFFGGLKGLEPSEVLDGQFLTKMFRGALETIKKRGKAQPGDKTMVDALEPAVIAMETMISDYQDKEGLKAGAQISLFRLLSAAAKAADGGVEATKQYTAKFGRAKSLMGRAVGYQDAGATSVSIIFHAMEKYVGELSQEGELK